MQKRSKRCWSSCSHILILPNRWSFSIQGGLISDLFSMSREHLSSHLHSVFSPSLCFWKKGPVTPISKLLSRYVWCISEFNTLKNIYARHACYRSRKRIPFALFAIWGFRTSISLKDYELLFVITSNFLQ